MNSLSIILYVADIVENLKGFFVFGSFLFVFASIFGVIITVSTRIEYNGDPSPWWMLLAPLFFLFICSFGAIFTPSKDAIYLIAGSEIGEQVIKTPEAQQMFEDIREVIKGQLNKLKETK